MPEIISRAEARAQGLRHFFDDVPCFHGHIGLKYVSYGGCLECAAHRHLNWRRKEPNRLKCLHRTLAEKAASPIVVKLRIRKAARRYAREARAAQLALAEMGIVCERESQAHRALRELGIRVKSGDTNEHGTAS